MDLLLGKLKAARRRLDGVPELIKRFRKSVLAEAVSGRLTEEWREEHGAELPSAEELLAQVRKERREAWEKAEFETMAAKGRVPRDEGWKEKYTEVAISSNRGNSNFPALWCLVPADSVAGFITKGTTPSADVMQSEGEIPFIKVYNLTFSDVLDFSISPAFIPFEVHADDLGRSMCRSGDVLMNIVGPPLGKVAIVPSDIQNCNINQAIARFRPTAILFNRYLSLVLLSEKTQLDLVGKTKATSGQFNLTLEICRDISIPLPSLPEQHEIVRRVDELFAYAEALEARVAAERLEPSILAKAFRGELSEQIPEEAAEWEKTLAEIEKAAGELGEKVTRRGRRAKTAVALEEGPAPRKRGRPVKAEAKMVEPSPAPRRRGRPPKAAAPAETPKRPRGRPRKG